MNIRSAMLRSAVAAGALGSSGIVQAQGTAEPQPQSQPQPRTPPQEERDRIGRDNIVVEGYLPREEGLSTPQSALPLLDTPQTVTVMEDELLEEQGRHTLRDALRNITGISIQAGEGSVPGGGDAFSVRGFSAREDVLRDGMRDIGMYFRDPFNNQRIEVTKGPASAFAGRGNVGGTINLISRYPVLDDGASVDFTVGTDNLYRATLDSNFILSQDLGAAIRFNAMVNSNDVPGRDVTRNRRWAINPSIAIGIDTDTEFSLHWMHLEQNDIPDYGVPNVRNLTFVNDPNVGGPAPVRRSNFYGYSNDYYDITADVVTARLDHVFNDWLSLRSQARYGRVHNDSIVSAPLFQATETIINPGTQVFGRAKPRDQVDQIAISQTNLTALLGPPSFQHTLVAGVEFVNESMRNRRRLDTDGPLMSLSNPVLQPAPVIPYQGTRARLDVDSIGAYLFDTIELGERFRIVAGLRFDAIDTRVRSFDDTGLFPGYVIDLSSTDREWSYNAAFVWKPTPSSSVYLAYGTSFEPSGRVEVVLLAGRSNAPPVTPAALNADPERTDAWELGGRVELLGGRATLAAALFQLSRDNARTPGANPTDPAVLFNGTQRARGFELNFVGQLAPGWNMLAGYTYLDAEIRTSAVPSEIGQPLDNSPRHSAALWTSYQITPEFQIGGGIQHVGSRLSGRPVGFFTVRVPAYTVGDLFAEYRFSPNARVRVNVMNVTNEYYFQSFFSNHSIPAPARSASATLTVDF
ncbi:MAG: TonB-dependent receptor [Sphingomonas sp.]